jgi:arylsulfatase A-like enzyme
VRLSCLAAAAALLLAGLSCAPDRPPVVQLEGDTLVGETVGLLIVVDGLGADTFESLQRQGRLPNITRYLIDRGVTVRRAADSLPTITYPNNVSMVTGTLPGRHGIMGNKWFDRYSLTLQDYTELRAYRRVDEDFSPQTIFECLHEDFTATVLLPVRRGATRNIDNWASAGIAWFLGDQPAVNHQVANRFELISRLANLSGRWPRFTLAYFATPDTVGHRRGIDDEGYIDILVDVDRQVGNICQSLRQAGLLEKTVVCLVSDHGFTNTPNHRDMRAFFQNELGIESREHIYGRDNPLEDRVAHFGSSRAVVVVNGDRRCDLHLRTGPHWFERPSAQEIESFVSRFAQRRLPHLSGGDGVPTLSQMLLAMPCTDLLTIRHGDNEVEVASRTGRAIIGRQCNPDGKTYSYQVASGGDPLGYDRFPQAAALCDGLCHSQDAWRQGTMDTYRPGAVPSLMELNDSPRCGDVAMFAAEGWDFGRANAGGHGGLTRQEMFVPFIWAGPGLPAGACLDGGWTVDTMPTMMELIGRGAKIPAGLDGKSIAARLRAAAPAGGAAPASAPAGN